jgi:hypothetical protein
LFNKSPAFLDHPMTIVEEHHLNASGMKLRKASVQKEGEKFITHQHHYTLTTVALHIIWNHPVANYNSGKNR